MEWKHENGKTGGKDGKVTELMIYLNTLAEKQCKF